MTPLEEFLTVNNIKQVDLVNYLKMSKGSISSAVSGRAQLSRRKIAELFSNPYGWDTSMLDKPTIVQTNGNNSPNSQNISLAGINELTSLRELNAVLRENIELWRDKCRLMEEKQKLMEERLSLLEEKLKHYEK